jgi:hypothetical protein
MKKEFYKVYTTKGIYGDRFLSPQHARLHVAKVTGLPVIKVERPIDASKELVFYTDLEEKNA